MKHRLPEIFQFKQKPGPGFCRVKGCRKDGHSAKFGLCHGHYQHAWRLCNEKASVYATLRDHARQRGIAFLLSKDYFDGLCDAYGFFEARKGDKHGDTLSLDRVNCDLPYQPGNVRIVSVSANVAKGNRERHLPRTVQDHLREIREQRQAELEEARCPF